MAAIPGMNPGLFIMGGGGDGGGSGQGGGKGNGKGGNGKGNNGGNSANGDGKGAGGCGPGSGGGCSNPAHGRAGGTHAGDPVDPVTGRVYTIPQTDLPLVGPLVFALKRGYSSFAHERDIGLGFGWSHSLAWSVELRRRTIVIAPPFLEPVTCDKPEPGAVLRARGVGALRIDEGAIVLTDAERGLIHLFEPSAPDPSRYQLAAVLDRAKNRIGLEYDARGALADLTDSAGRRVKVRRTAHGRIERFDLVTSRGRTVCYRRYEHDDSGDLIAVTDAKGRRVRFLYDDEHRLIEQAYPSGVRVVWRYDDSGRCVETWTDHGEAPDPALAEDVPAVLADGITRARGMLHVRIEHASGMTTVYDSRQAKRIDHNERGLIEKTAGAWVESLRYDAAGHVTEYSDPNNHATCYERDAAGRAIAVTGADGARDTFKYDAAGNLIEAADALGAALRYRYSDAGNLLETSDAPGSLLRCAYDARGLRVLAEMPNGATTLWEHDAEGNLVALTEPHGKSRRFEVDDTGRITAFTDEEGYRTAFHYDATNVLCSVTLPNGATYAVEHDADGRLAAWIGPDGATWRLSWGGYNCVHTLEKPTGEALNFRYDREGHLVQTVNERGETHRIERDSGGRIVAETFFDGRAYHYKVDAAGRLIRHENGAGERTELGRDACGRVVRREYDDGTADAFEYDAAGRLVRADNGTVGCTWSYDARGNLVRETQACEGRTVMVEHTYNAANQRTSTRANVGYAVSFERDVMGRAARVHVGRGIAIERTFDALGREVMRALPRGGHIVSRYDSFAMTERWIAGPRVERDRAEPAWVGRLPRETRFSESFTCSASGDLTEHATSTGERERFAYDPAGRILARMSAGAQEVYAYEGTGRMIEPLGSARSYGPGGTLLTRGAERFVYDAEGRRTMKVDEHEQATRYEWNGRGMLAAVVLPDGSRIENVYDTQGRRVVKRVRRPDGSRTETRFAWAGDELIHEIKWSLAPSAAPAPIAARAYAYDGGTPLAHRETVWREGDPHEGEWIHYALGPGEMPALLIGGDGALLARLRASVWGRIEAEAGAKARTPLRFSGQYEDAETGLFYNRFRFYDPAIGLYISADPIGLMGGLGAYEYVRSRPFRMSDPLGLAGKVVSTVTGSAGSFQDKSGAGSLHPIVDNALPTPDDNGIYPTGRPFLSACAEPKALSKYLYGWEDKNGKLDPSNKGQVSNCLNSIASIGAKENKKDGKGRCPCANCSQMLANLMDNYDAPNPSVIQPGSTTQDQGFGNFEPPHLDWKGPNAHQGYPTNNPPAKPGGFEAGAAQSGWLVGRSRAALGAT